MSESSDSPKYTNRLIDETSPYLLQHAHNPVDWYPWGEEALGKAREERRLILLSIGYSSCHWCHVMERESFENEEIARFMNEHFVNIKVDREERPDLDDIYMAATLAMNHGHGGWPMTVFLTPDLEPAFADTYFPPEDRYGQPGFPTLLQRIAHTWKEDPDGIQTGAARLTAQLRAQRQGSTPLSVGESELQLALSQFGADFDPTFGGFGTAPKFPPSAGLSLLLRLYRRFDDAHALHMVRKTLDATRSGGMHDHSAAASRYSTDRQWLVPHSRLDRRLSRSLGILQLPAHRAAFSFRRHSRDPLRAIGRYSPRLARRSASPPTTRRKYIPCASRLSSQL